MFAREVFNSSRLKRGQEVFNASRVYLVDSRGEVFNSSRVYSVDSRGSARQDSCVCFRPGGQTGGSARQDAWAKANTRMLLLGVVACR
jgi:hypothetical protein